MKMLKICLLLYCFAVMNINIFHYYNNSITEYVRMTHHQRPDSSHSTVTSATCCHEDALRNNW